MEGVGSQLAACESPMESSESDEEGSCAPPLPANASILQCVKGVITIFETAKMVDFTIIDRETMLSLYDDRREQVLLHDDNVLAVLKAIYDACIADEVILDKLHRRTISGGLRRVSREDEDTKVDAIVIDDD